MNTTERMLLTMGLAATLVTAMASSAMAASGPTPSSGPTNGGTTVTVPTPGAKVRFTSIDTSGRHMFAFGDDNKLYAWGINDSGQLGDGTNTDQLIPTPVRVPSGINFKTISVGWSSTYGITPAGEAYRWGYLMGSNPGRSTNTPEALNLPSGQKVQQISQFGSFGLALDSAGDTYSFGSNDYGQLGIGVAGNVPDELNKVFLPQGRKFVEVATSQSTSYALADDGSAWAWGYGRMGEMGDGTTAQVNPLPKPVSMPPAVRFTQLVAGETPLALGDDGNLYTWGYNRDGQLGNGNTQNQSRPVQVALPSGVRVKQFDSGFVHSVALGDDGQVYAWGRNNEGEIGDNTHEVRSTPVPVTIPGSPKVTRVAAGLTDSFALTEDGSIFAWGDVWEGGLGDGTTSSHPTPVLVAQPTPKVTRVLFDGVAGGDLKDNGDGTYSVISPKHTAGAVDVTVEWSVAGVQQTPVTYRSGYTYSGPGTSRPTISKPSDQSVRIGGTAEFSVVAGGAPSPKITWEVSSDHGKSWKPILNDSSAQVSADGRHLRIPKAPKSHDGFMYRATATNSSGSVTSDPGSLAVLADEQPPATHTPSASPAPTNNLATTGGGSLLLLGIGGIVLVALASILLARRKAV